MCVRTVLDIDEIGRIIDASEIDDVVILRDRYSSLLEDASDDQRDRYVVLLNRTKQRLKKINV